MPVFKLQLKAMDARGSEGVNYIERPIGNFSASSMRQLEQAEQSVQESYNLKRETVTHRFQRNLREEDTLEAIYRSKHRMHASILIIAALLLSGLSLGTALAATSLFDPERGAQASAGSQPSANRSGTLYELRLDGVLRVGNHHRVIISGPKGEIYRFNWQGPIIAPLAFKEESTGKLAGFRLSSVDSRSVWLRLPSGTSCEPDPEKGLIACEKGRAKLALVARSFPEGSIAPAGNQAKLPPKQHTSAKAYRRQPSSNARQASSAASTRSARRTTTAQGTRVTKISKRLKGSTAPTNSQSTSNSSSSQSQTTQSTSPQIVDETPARAQLRVQQQQLIDSAPPGYFGVK